MTLPMDGKGVFLTRVQRFAYGHKVGYKVYTEYDGFESVSFEDFWELEAMITTAGHAKPDRLHGHITDLNHIKAELTVMDNSYRVACIYASDNTKVTREQVIEARANKRVATIKPKPMQTWQADIAVNEWIETHIGGVPALLAPQYGHRPKPALRHFKRSDDSMMYAVKNSMKARGQLFVPVAVQPAA